MTKYIYSNMVNCFFSNMRWSALTIREEILHPVLAPSSVKALTIRGDIALSSYSQFGEGFNNKGGDIAPSSVTLKIYSDSQATKNFLDRRGGVVQWIAYLPCNVEVVGSSPIKGPRCFLEQKTLPLLLSTGWFQKRIRA